MCCDQRRCYPGDRALRLPTKVTSYLSIKLLSPPAPRPILHRTLFLLSRSLYLGAGEHRERERAHTRKHFACSLCLPWVVVQMEFDSCKGEASDKGLLTPSRVLVSRRHQHGLFKCVHKHANIAHDSLTVRMYSSSGSTPYSSFNSNNSRNKSG